MSAPSEMSEKSGQRVAEVLLAEVLLAEVLLAEVTLPVLSVAARGRVLANMDRLTDADRQLC